MLGDRSLFPALEVAHYFNHAAISPPSSAVRTACDAVVLDYSRRGAAAWLTHTEQRVALRARLARLIAGHEDEIALVGGTGLAASLIALSIRWRPGDRVLCLRGEFPANVTPWQRAALRFGLQTVFLDADAFAPGGDGLQQLEGALRGGVRLLAVSAVQFQTGLRMPLAAMARLCRAYDTRVFVDAIQAAGAMPIDVGKIGVDYLAAGGHKWLMGVEGTGFLWIRRDRVAELEPAIAGWLSHEDGTRFLFEGAGHLRYDRPLRVRADVFEGGVMNSIGFAALDAATRILETIGTDRIFAHVQGLLDALESALVARGLHSVRSAHPEARSCILSAIPPDDIDLATLARTMAERGVAVATPDGHLRFSPHWPNDLDQVPAVLDAVDHALVGARRPSTP